MTCKKTILACLFLSVILYSFRLQKNNNYNIVFIGDSITQAGGVEDSKINGPAAKAVEYLLNTGHFKAVQFSNQGRSGFTTVDFLPAVNKAFPNVIKAADTFYNDKSAILVFSIMLGTNDSAVKGPNGAPVSCDNYHANLKTIADSLYKRYPACKIIIHEPLWYSDSTRNNATYFVEGRERLQSYMPEIEALVKEYKNIRPGQMFLGDKTGYGYFRKNYLTDMRVQTGPSGTFYLHPNKKGSAVLGELWGKAIAKALK